MITLIKPKSKSKPAVKPSIAKVKPEKTGRFSMYHHGLGTLGPTLRLNMLAVRELLSKPVAHFDVLTAEELKELEFRFNVYCQHGSPDFTLGNEQTGIPPAINNLPNSTALSIAKAIKYTPGIN